MEKIILKVMEVKMEVKQKIALKVHRVLLDLIQFVKKDNSNIKQIKRKRVIHQKIKLYVLIVIILVALGKFIINLMNKFKVINNIY
jgi:hypothetical protein